MKVARREVGIWGGCALLRPETALEAAAAYEKACGACLTAVLQ
jgi:hypothetical protein